MLEQYDVLGCATRGVASTHLRVATDQYDAGKYVADGVYDTTAVDKLRPREGRRPHADQRGSGNLGRPGGAIPIRLPEKAFTIGTAKND
jgi:hypothetical protein